ncbi:hypothetical protein [Megasphaera vaginalis (ex Srinivasan et al. 2021)]|uniref:hypothetical protein n=1 Tax=Megasphaera vaginalis (ex Srinivasan et al. 2021) TaxID=1111454 RepID=UPI0012DF9EC5|nr:hypothetical protein [Megasphaera vaginalis (ex Srinivasan et al. 2021)]
MDYISLATLSEKKNEPCNTATNVGDITDEQGRKWLLKKSYDLGYRYIAVNILGELCLCKVRPTRDRGFWCSPGDNAMPISKLPNIFFEIKWDGDVLLDIAKELKIVDWSKVEVNTEVLVSADGETWCNRHFASYDEETRLFYTFIDGKTWWTTDDVEEWHFCKMPSGE